MRRLLLLSAVSVALFAGRASGVTFADGQLHTIDAGNSYPFEGIVVEDGPGGTITSVVVATGGLVGGPIHLHGHSEATIEGGIVNNAVVAWGASSITMSSGTVYGSIAALDDGRARFSGGSVLALIAEDNGSYTMTGGNTEAVQCFSASSSLIGGGAVAGYVAVSKSCHLRIDDGEFATSGLTSDSLSVGEGGRVLVVGGTYHADITVQQTGSEVELIGGDLRGDIFALNGAVLRISGSDFNYPFGSLSPLSGALSGSLADGMAIDSPFGRASTASIILVDAPAELATCLDDREALQTALDMCNATVIGTNGDFNGDGEADVVDLTIYRRWLAGFPVP